MSRTLAIQERQSNRNWFLPSLVMAGIALLVVAATVQTSALGPVEATRRGGAEAATVVGPDAVAPTAGTSVPDAVTALCGRDLPDPEPAPAF